MGALVVRSLYDHFDLHNSSFRILRIVMIAPPNTGTYVADFFSKFGFLNYFTGPNVENLTLNPNIGAMKYPKPTCEVGIIAGYKGNKYGYNFLIKGDNDGLLQPEQTKLGIEKDFILIKSSHWKLLNNNEVINQTKSFLLHGKFENT
jgi:triacylglycerol lipase